MPMFGSGALKRLRDMLRSSAVALPPAATFTMTQLATPNRIHQRLTTTGGGQGKGTGVVSVGLGVATAGTIYARARSTEDGTTILQPAYLAVSNAGAGGGPVAIPGVDARLGWFYLDLSGDGVTWFNGTTPIGMGRLVGFAGQSLAVRLFSTSPGSSQTDTTTIAAAGASVSAYGRVFATADAGSGTTAAAWVQPADGTAINSAGAAEFLTLQAAAFGVNIGMVGNAVGQTAIASWQPGQANYNDLATNLAKAGGAFEDFFWFQGHSDAQYGATGYDAYRTGLRAFMAGVVGLNARSTRVFVATIPNINSTNYGSIDQRNVIRGAALDEAAASGWTYLAFADLELIADGIHQAQSGARRTARHVHRAMAGSDAGPLIGAASHPAGTTIVMTPTLPAGATALVAVGSPAARFQVFAHGDTASPLALDGTTPIAVTATRITLKLASDPGQVPLDIYPYGVAPVNDGSADGVYDNRVDGDSIAVGRQLAAAVRPVCVRVAAPLALTAPTYAAARFGNGLGAGSGLAGTNMFPAAATGFTLEWWLRVDSLPGGLQVIMGQGEGFYIGQSGADLNLSGSGVAGVFAVGGGYHMALVAHPGFTAQDFYVNGLLAASYPAGGILQNTSLTGHSFGIRSFGDIGYTYTSGTVDEVAIFDGARYTAPFTPPSTPYTGHEAGLVHLWHLDGDGNDSAAPA